jgi:hypothetical protein
VIAAKNAAKMDGPRLEQAGTDADSAKTSETRAKLSMRK